MKKVAPALLSIALIAASASALAEGESVDLTVTGSVVPSACVPTLDKGELDWGTIPSSALEADFPTFLDAKDLALAITCAASTQFALQIVDNKADSVLPGSGAEDRGMGFAGNTNIPIGNYRIYPWLAGGTGDGNPAGMLRSSDEGATWDPRLGEGFVGVTSTEWLALTRSAETPYRPTFFTQATLTFKVLPVLNSGAELPIGERDIALAGSSTFEVRYL